MAYMLAPGVHVAQIDDCAIVLDTIADRYRKLNPALTGALNDLLIGSPRPPTEALAALRRHRVVAETDHPVTSDRHDVASPSQSIFDMAGATASGLVVATGIALAAARARLRLVGLAATLAHARGMAACAHHADARQAAALARGFNAARSWLPFKRACLPDALALHARLSRRGLRSTLVIGVRDHPFNAHCWVQSHELVLTDPLDEIRALTPILSL